MGEFHEHYRQKKMQRLPLCDYHVRNNLVAPHDMVDISWSDTECVWCGTDDVHRHADWLVDLRVKVSSEDDG